MGKECFDEDECLLRPGIHRQNHDSYDVIHDTKIVTEIPETELMVVRRIALILSVPLFAFVSKDSKKIYRKQMVAQVYMQTLLLIGCQWRRNRYQLKNSFRL